MDRTHGDEQRLSAPLTRDLELRPRGETPATVGRALSPLIRHYTEQLVDNTKRLNELAESARDSQDRKAEVLLRAKIVDQATAVLRLCRDEATPTTETWRPLCQDDLPNMELLPPRVQEQFVEGYRLLAEAERLAEEMWGPTWEQRWYDLSGVPRWPKQTG